MAYGRAARQTQQLGQTLVAQLSSDRLLNVGANVPYGVSVDADYALVVPSTIGAQRSL